MGLLSHCPSGGAHVFNCGLLYALLVEGPQFFRLYDVILNSYWIRLLDTVSSGKYISNMRVAAAQNSDTDEELRLILK